MAQGYRISEHGLALLADKENEEPKP